MDQFNSRMEAQRKVIKVVNSSQQWQEELCGLSAKAINRWIYINQIPRGGEIPKLLVRISELLFFLATKSQDQLSDEYRSYLADVLVLTASLEKQFA